MPDKKSFLLFLAAAFSLTQIHVVGYIGISELCMMVAGPFVLYKNWEILKREGFQTVIVLAMLWALSAAVTDIYRETQFSIALKGLASPLSVAMMVPCFHALLRDDIRRVKWAIIGFCATVFLSTYFIQQGVSVEVGNMLGLSAKEAAEEYKLSLLFQVMSVALLLPALGYLRMPIVSTVVTLAVAIFALVEGGRANFLATGISTGMMLFAARGEAHVRHIARIVPLMLFTVIVFALLAKVGYQYAAVNGYMGETEEQKYEKQSSSKIGLLSGRPEFLAVALAIRDSPILGHGSWAIDFEDYNGQAAELLGDETLPASRGLGYINAHSHIMCAYIWHGVLGAIFWLYVLAVMWHFFRHDMGVVPELYGWAAVVLPSMLWAILFSPFSERVMKVCIIVVFLLIRQISKQRRLARMGGVW